MVTLIQRLLQLLVLVVIGYLIVKPDVLPQPARLAAYNVQYFMFGPQVSWSSFQQNWMDKWRFLTTTVPVIGSWAAMAAPEPQPISADSIMNMIINIVLVQPEKKWNSIKQQFMGQPTPTASASAAF